MKVTKAQAEENRVRIIEVASQLFREKGFDGIGLNDLMHAAGLTRGGFYGHFESKQDLAVQACRHALSSAGNAWGDEKNASREASLAAIVEFYLSDQHCDHPAQGCALSALCNDVGRQGNELKATFAEGVTHFLGVLGDRVDADTPQASRAKAMATLSMLVGAVVLSRAVGDTALSSDIRHAAAHAVLDL